VIGVMEEAVEVVSPVTLDLRDPTRPEGGLALAVAITE